jgi:hypothetical protein
MGKVVDYVSRGPQVRGPRFSSTDLVLRHSYESIVDPEPDGAAFLGVVWRFVKNSRSRFACNPFSRCMIAVPAWRFLLANRRFYTYILPSYKYRCVIIRKSPLTNRKIHISFIAGCPCMRPIALHHSAVWFLSI